jgi:2-methylcitrate dehydratase PrpD
VIHPAIDAAIAIGQRIGRATIARVQGAVHPRALDLADRRHPDTAITARFSLQHAIALALVTSRAGHTEFDTIDVNDTRMRALRDRIDLRGDGTLSPAQARLHVVLDDGRALEEFIAAPSGSPERPLTDLALKRKFMSLAELTIARAAAERLFAMCEHLTSVQDCNMFAECWTGHSAPSHR